MLMMISNLIHSSTRFLLIETHNLCCLWIVRLLCSMKEQWKRMGGDRLFGTLFHILSVTILWLHEHVHISACVCVWFWLVGLTLTILCAAWLPKIFCFIKPRTFWASLSLIFWLVALIMSTIVFYYAKNHLSKLGSSNLNWIILS